MAVRIRVTSLMVWLARPVLCRLARAMVAAGKGDLGVNSLAVVLALLFVCSAVTNRIGIFAIFGAFLFGAVLSGEAQVREKSTFVVPR